MRDYLLEILIEWPMPAIWLTMAGYILGWRLGRRWGRWLAIGAALGLVASSVPLVGLVLLRPLAAVPPYVAPDGIAAIVVPTAGVFVDSRGQWWSGGNTIRRVSRGLQLQSATGLPLYIAGGGSSGDRGGLSEARIVLEQMGIPPGTVRLEETARNTDETGRAIAELLAADSSAAGPFTVVVVTDRPHGIRMAASLRANGVAVVMSLETGLEEEVRHSNFLPSVWGLKLTAAALHEYVGIAWYLARGNFRVADLFSIGWRRLH